jgi:hypothetical protein
MRNDTKLLFKKASILPSLNVLKFQKDKLMYINTDKIFLRLQQRKKLRQYCKEYCKDSKSHSGRLKHDFRTYTNLHFYNSICQSDNK